MMVSLEYVTFTGYLDDCRRCDLQASCMRKPPTKTGRQETLVRSGHVDQTAVTRMKRKIDSLEGRGIYEQRIGVVEPVFGNINTNKRMDRFRHRGKLKVNAQWMMYCMVQNIEKIQRYGNLV